MVFEALAGGGAGGGQGDFKPPNLRGGCGERGGLRSGGRWEAFLLPSSVPQQGWAQGPKPGFCCPLVSELIPSPWLLPLPSTRMGKGVQVRVPRQAEGRSTWALETGRTGSDPANSASCTTLGCLLLVLLL